jgi:serine/threonine-protein kinase ATR
MLSTFRFPNYLFSTSTVLQGNLALSASKESKIIWLVSAKLARKSGNFQTAFSALLRAESELMDSAIFLERSRLFHATGRHELAFRELSHALRSKGDPNSDPIDPEVSVVISTPAITLTPVSERETNLRAKGALLLARWLQQSSFGRTVDVEAWYKEVTVVSPKWEKAWFFIGRYYNQLLDERNSRYQTICEALEATKDRNDRRNAEKEKFDSFLGIGEAIAAVIKCYSRSLQYGTQNIFRSLPRLITLWLDFTVPIADDLKEKKSG